MSLRCHGCRDVPASPEHVDGAAVGEVPLNSRDYFLVADGNAEPTPISGRQARQLVRALPSLTHTRTTTTFGVQSTTVFATATPPDRQSTGRNRT